MLLACTREVQVFHEDILGQGYKAETMQLRSDDEGEVVATLVHRKAAAPTGKAVLYVHGYNDYFFQAEKGVRFNEAGYDFYALDLRKYGRSIRSHQTQTFVRDVNLYFEELDEALRRIRDRDQHDHVALLAHSTGGLVGALYAHERRDRGLLNAVCLNSPFFDFPGTWYQEFALETAITMLGKVAPRTVVQASSTPYYAWSLHRRYERGGDAVYDESWKKPGTLPMLAGWVSAIREGQLRLQAGLDIHCPVMVLHSARSGGGDAWNDSYLDSDVVLDVRDIAKFTGVIGRHVTKVAIDGGLHDLALSLPPVREQYYRHVLGFLRGV
jgi:alpha-beta hydrolase superfamily lysophospholipase